MRGPSRLWYVDVKAPIIGSPAPLRLRRVSHEDVALPDEEINDFLRKRRRVRRTRCCR